MMRAFQRAAVDEERTSTSASPSQTFLGVQYLRGLAALLVVYHHAFTTRPLAQWADWGAFGVWGVDVFFVISGFIMGRSISGRKQNPGRFLIKRAVRVLPMYWIALTAWIIVRLVVPDRLANQDVNFFTVPMSYLLLPHYHAVFSTHVWPILIPGWTLQFEMFFYFILAVCMAITIPERVKSVAVFLMMALVAIGIGQMSNNPFFVTYTNPLLLEFCLGLLLSQNLSLLKDLGVKAGLFLAIMSFGIVVATGSTVLPPWIEIADLGVAATVTVGSFIAIEPMCKERAAPFLLLLGDASYSLYLFHGIAIAAGALFFEKFVPKIGSVALLPVMVVLAIGAGIGIHVLIERPVLRLLNRLISKTSLFR